MEETVDLSKDTDKLITLLQIESSFELTTVVVLDNHCIGSCKSNYHTMMTTTPLILNQKITNSSRLFFSKAVRSIRYLYIQVMHDHEM